MLRQDIDLILVVGMILEELDLRHHLIGERVAHHEAWVACSAAQVYQAPFGKQDDAVSELGLAAVTKSGTKSLEFRFRYFQHLTGVITLPDGFTAHKVELTVRATGKKAPEPVAEVFDWPDSADWNKGE